MTDYSTSQKSDRPPVRTTTLTPAEDMRAIALNQVSWGAVLAGVVLALVIQLLLNLLGIGIGVATIDPGGADSPTISIFSIAAGIWYVVTGIAAAFNSDERLGGTGVGQYGKIP